MNKKIYLIVLMALAAGFFAGKINISFKGADTAYAQRMNEVLSVKGIQIVDNYGNTRIRLAVFSSGEPGISFYNPQGEVMAQFRDKSLSFLDSKGNTRAVMQVDFLSGEPSITLFDEEGKPVK